MENKYNFNEELRDIKKFDLGNTTLTPLNIKLLNILGKISCCMFKVDSRINVTNKLIPGYNSDKIKINIYEPKNIEKNAPCLLYFHSGAFMTEGYGYMHKMACFYSLNANCKVIFVNYRLAPKYPFPFGVEDCYSSLVWVYKHADEIGISKDKIAVFGDSAGGALAAAIPHISRDRNGPTICFQMLIYPVTDISQSYESIEEFFDSPGWNSNLNRQMWKYYLKDGDKGMLGYASPMSMDRFYDLPDAYIEVEEYDCLRDEGIAYSKRLQENGCKVELNFIRGTFHGFDAMAKDDKLIVRETMVKRINALKRAFS